ncbi:kinase-like domain-containing protein [Daldinia vernicosa]|uniref:kinase-like domain-containing protein n=1 Tax=Daldinia vernicosa TaxID=114800 RepID=UPI002007E21C|nr:kinase-like domain-containing protein [Daldinia vernicosa]KAI0846652.1 kinase-like domain-containing protein [Daldinia vernicosa]
MKPNTDSLFGDPVESINDDGDKDGPLGSADIPPHHDNPAYGLQWIRDDSSFSARPEWTLEPTVDAIILTLQKIVGPDKEYMVQHYWNGVYSKIYRVSYDEIRLVLKISLPVCPKSMTESEVATLQWIKENTHLPVPKVRHYDSSRDNPIGFEWILMDYIDGIPLSQCWESITQGSKERIVKQIAEYAAISFTRQFRGIGNIYPSESHQSNIQPRVGEMASMAMPFRTAFKWTKCRLRLISAELRLRLDEVIDEDHRKTISSMLNLVDRLRELEDKFFIAPRPPNDSEQQVYEDESTDEEDIEVIDNGNKPCEPTMLWHDDISLDNILVDENGILVGIIGWSCVSCLPLYEACQLPAFLHQTWDRPLEPLTPYSITRAHLDLNKEVWTYGIKLRQHHITLLRQVFIDEMMQRCQEWVDVFYNQKHRRDYEAAVQNCDNEFAYKIVEEWVGAAEGRSDSDKPLWSLHVRLMG